MRRSSGSASATRYQVNLDLLVGPDFAPIITRRMSSEGDLTAEGLTPSRYDEDTQVVFRDRRRISVDFQPEGVVLANGQRRERWPGVQDTASQFIQLTWMFTTRPRAAARRQHLRVAARAAAQHGPLDLRRARRGRDRHVVRAAADVPSEAAASNTQARRTGSVEIWFAPQLRYLPVRIRIEQDPETYLDLVIARKPDLAGR